MNKKWFYRLIAPFLNQRGAVGEDGAESNDEGGTDDDVFGDLVSSDIYTEEGDQLADKNDDLKEDDKEEKGEKKEPTMADVIARLDATEKKNEELEKAARRAFYQERHDKKASKSEGKEETVLTDAEIKAIIKDNANDPEVMFNALVYKMQQQAKAGQRAAVDEVEVKAKSNQLTAILKERVPDYDSPESKAAEVISKAKDTFSLQDHPFADYLAASAAVYADLPNISKQWFEAGKKAALDESADAARKKEIKSGQLTPGGKRGNGDQKGSATLSESERETFDRIYGHIKDEKSRNEKMRLFKTQLASRKAA